ncbi:unnamed protein product [Brassica napus]|uniref:(rape) hypothetical protein n=1 Tax=Brassica napus TaxID=3708 RepID=A0A816VHA6_BRANA|nr:unnamed protein product [Brassica napus]
MEPKGNSPNSGDRNTNKKTVASSATPRPSRKSTGSSDTVMKPNGKSPVLSALSSARGDQVTPRPSRKSTGSSDTVMKPNGKSHVSSALSSARGDQVMLFRDVSFGPHEADLRFRLIHFWEARNPNSKTLIGQEMLLIDEEGTVIQGFVPAGRVGTYELASGSVYKLSNFYGSRNKAQYRVTDHSATVTFAWNSELSVIDNPPVAFQEDRFRFYSYEEFQADCDRKINLYDYVGHMKLVDGQAITERMVLDEVDIAEKRHLLMKLYLWDQAASEFCEKFKLYVSTPSVLLVTTVNPKHLGGTLALTSMSSSRVFMDADVQPSRDYLAWYAFCSNSDIANKIDAEVVTKPETATLAELFSYIKLETAKVAWFECTTTIDDVVRGSAWYYISCGGCNSKAVNGPTSLICNNKKCDKSVVTGVPQYLTRINVYDKSEQAVFVILGDAGRELTGKYASELVASYFECNEGVEADQCVPVPQALLDTIGQTHKFIVKVSDLNFSGKTQTITVTKVFPPEAPHHVALLEEHAVPSTSDDVLKSVSEDSGPIRGLDGTVGERVRKASDGMEPDEAKRPKSG